MSLVLSGRPPAHAGWMLALWWNRFSEWCFPLIAAMRARPSASVAWSRAASVEGGSLTSSVTRNRRVAGGADEVARLTHVVDIAENDAGSALGEIRGNDLADAMAAPVTSAIRPAGVQRSCSAACGRPLCECGPIGVYEATAGLSTCSHHWRKLVGVEFCGVRWTPLSRPWFLAQARSVYP
jgi:hypothetical protein